MLGLAARPAGAQLQAAEAAVGPVEGEDQASRALAAFFQAAAERQDQGLQPQRDGLGRVARLWQRQALDEGRHRRQGRDRLPRPAQGLGQAVRHHGPEAPGQAAGGQVVEVADPPQAEALQQLDLAGGQAQRRDRQPGQGRLCRARRDDAGGSTLASASLGAGAGAFASAFAFGGTEAGHRPGQARGLGQGGAGGEALPCQALDQRRQQGRLAAEEMGAAGDVEQQAGRPAAVAGAAVGGDPGGEAAAPGGQGGKRPKVGRRVLLGGLQVGQDRPGVGQGLPRRQAGRGRPVVDRRQQQAAALLAQQDPGPSRPGGPLPNLPLRLPLHQPVGRKTGQPD